MGQFRHADDTCANEPSLGDVGSEAAEAIRTLNHFTRPAAAALSDPTDAAELAAALACVTRRLPQLLDQVGRWLVDQHRTGRLRVDALSPCPDVSAATETVTSCLGVAARYADAAARALDIAHQQLAHLAQRPEAEPLIDRERALDL